MKSKGVCYDVGRLLEGSPSRPIFDARTVHRELEIIKKDLHCNSVRIQGLDLDRLMVAAEHALKLGLEVVFSPEMFERGQKETIEYLVKAASAAESLRELSPNIVFSVGSEATLFMQGFAEGNNLMERMNHPSFWEDVRTGKYNEPLNAFLAKANEAVREMFHGEVTYFSVPLEKVDWSIFDYVGLDLYRDDRTRETYGKMVKPYLLNNKPVLIGEFGCSTYRGAERLGGMSWAIIFGMLVGQIDPGRALPKSITDILNIPTRMDGHYVRDEELQARELTDQLRVLDEAGVDGTFVFTFVSPTLPYNEDPRYDLDMVSYSLVKSYAEKASVDEIIDQAAQQGKELGVEVDHEVLARFMGEVGKKGTTYPEMPWDPKESFRSVAAYYSNDQG